MNYHQSRIFRLIVTGKKYLSVIPDDLTYFQSHFIGKRLPNDWRPPEIHVMGKSKKAADFIAWMVAAPLVSERAKDVLESILSDDVQFLPFHEIKGKKYFAMNVTRVERAVLDLERSDIPQSKVDPTWAMSLDSAVFLKNTIPVLPPIFKVGLSCDRVFGDIFVSDVFADIAVEHKLTGIALADPAHDPVRMAISGGTRNIVAGLPL